MTLLGAQGHPGGAAHVLLLAVVALAGLIVLSVNRLSKRRTRRDAEHNELDADTSGRSHSHPPTAGQRPHPGSESDDSSPRRTMKYALLVYGHESWDRLDTEQQRSLHSGHRSPHEEPRTSDTASVNMIAHYRFRPPEQTTTIRLVDDQLSTTQGPSLVTHEALRALYLLESDTPSAVQELACRLPAVDIGGTVQIWPLIEPNSHQQGRGPSDQAA